MVVDKFENFAFYKTLLNNFEAGVRAIESQLKTLEVGRYEFEGGFFMVQKGDTKPMEEGLFETHQKYVDVQIVMEGSEEIAWADLKDLKEEIPYNPEKDAAFHSGETSQNMLISSGMFYIAFPHDGHRPVRHTQTPQHFTKIVLKLPVNA